MISPTATKQFDSFIGARLHAVLFAFYFDFLLARNRRRKQRIEKQSRLRLRLFTFLSGIYYSKVIPGAKQHSRDERLLL
jgi:hypothetical protein